MHPILRGLTASLVMSAASSLSAPTVYPTGTTIYDPVRAWNGYTVLTVLDTPAVLVIDMNGNVVKRWDDFMLAAGGPARILPDGSLIAPQGNNPGQQESTDLVHLGFDGIERWRYNRNEQISLQGKNTWSTRQHHDWQRADFPAGYYSPASLPGTGPTRTLLLTHTNHIHAELGDKPVKADRLVEISAQGELLWQWNSSEHFGEYGFDEAAVSSIRRQVGSATAAYDWMHINSATYVGPNRWFDAGDVRFHPENIMLSSRHANVVFIINRDGEVVWRIGPDFSRTPEEQGIGQVIGQHHAHLIPPGLPGAGNLLLFDNGGSSGYGEPSAIAPTGLGIYARSTSRILEIDPLTLERVWTYSDPGFFSTNISGAQRLANGNTLVTEGAPGRVFEVTSSGEIVWEFMNWPGEGSPRGKALWPSNSVYRAYRFPYGWLPLPVPAEKAVLAPDPRLFRVP